MSYSLSSIFFSWKPACISAQNIADLNPARGGPSCSPQTFSARAARKERRGWQRWGDAYVLCVCVCACVLCVVHARVLCVVRACTCVCCACVHAHVLCVVHTRVCVVCRTHTTHTRAHIGIPTPVPAHPAQHVYFVLCMHARVCVVHACMHMCFVLCIHVRVCVCVVQDTHDTHTCTHWHPHPRARAPRAARVPGCGAYPPKQGRAL